MAKTFFAWVTILTPSAARLLTSGLVERGYEVGAAAQNRRLFWEGEASCLVALKIDDRRTGTGDNAPATNTILMNNIKEVLNGIGSMWHSMVIQGEGTTLWEGSNIVLPKGPPKPAPEPPKDKDRFDLMEAEEAKS